jgi:dipeptide/tripeptide permease
MLQRKQSLWLLIAALLNAGVFYFGLYRYHIIENGVDTPRQIRVNDHLPSLLIALVMTLLPLVTIFMFRARKRQLTLCFVSILAVCSFITIALQRTKNLNAVPASESYWIGTVLPVVSIVFLIMAMIGIRKDEKLVRSVDRLR